MLNSQDLMVIRDVALELGDIDLAHDLNAVGDKLADALKDRIDTRGIPDSDLRGFLKKRVPSREKIEQIRAAGIVADDEFVQAFADSLLEIRQAVRGGTLNPRSNHWTDV